jgi:uncharacterized membrane protein
VDLSSLFPLFLFLHVMGAILAFGPTYAYSIMGAMAGREPQHANFSARQTEAIGNRLVYPLAAIQFVTGALLIIAGKIDVTATHWLELGILLYVFVFVYALTVQRNALLKLIELGSTPPPAGTPPGPPPPIVLATVAKIQRGGIGLGLCLVVIVFLMVVKPSF